MIDIVIVHPAIRNRLREGPLGPTLEGVAQALHAQGYSATTIRAYLRTGVRCGGRAAAQYPTVPACPHTLPAWA